MREFDAIVVGGGLSGLYAARTLANKGVRVAVLEARDRVGGLTYSPHSDILGARFDLGGQWVSVRHHRMQDLIARFGVRLIRQWWKGDRVRLHGAAAHVGAADAVPGLSEEQLEEQRVGLEHLYSAFEDVPQNAWESPRAAELDSMTFATWAGRTAKSEAVHGWFMRMTSAYYGARAEQISALEALCKLRYCGGPIFMSDVETGGQSTHLVGSAAVSEGMMSELDLVELSSPVRRVEWSQNRVLVTTDRATLSARYLVCAVPPAMVAQIQFDPPLPAARRQLHQRFPSGRYTKVVMIYDRPFWRDRNLNGNVIATDGSLTSLYDMGDETTDRPIIAGLFGGIAAQGIDDLAPEDRRSRVLGLASRALGSEAAKPQAYYEQIWANEEWSAGASSPFMVPGVISTVGGQLRAPCGPIHWAGVHMAREYRGYMEGALAAGEDAAKAILALEA